MSWRDAIEREVQRQIVRDDLKRRERQERRAVASAANYQPKAPKPPARPPCGARTRAGSPCIMKAEPGKHRCRLHGGKSTGPRTVEGRERIRQAQFRRWCITRTANSSG